MIHNYGEGKNFVTVHVEVSSDMNIVVAHDLADKIEEDFKEKLNINMTIHIDPLDVKDKNVIDLRQKIKSILNEYDQNIQIHDFRIVKGKKSKLIFDAVIPFEKDYCEKDLIKILNDNLKTEEEYDFKINVEKPIC